jgi:hypothetical protein
MEFSNLFIFWQVRLWLPKDQSLWFPMETVFQIHRTPMDFDLDYFHTYPTPKCLKSRKSDAMGLSRRCQMSAKNEEMCNKNA